MGNIITRNYPDKPLPNNSMLRQIFKEEFPLSVDDNIRIVEYRNIKFIHEEKNNIPIQIDRKRENCFSVKEKITTSFIYGDKGGGKPGYCELSLEPYPNTNKILVTNDFQESTKWKMSTERLKEFDNYHIEIEAIMYFQYIAQSIVDFCDRFKIIETHFRILDVNYNIIDTSPTKYKYAMSAEMFKLFSESRFSKIE